MSAPGFIVVFGRRATALLAALSGSLPACPLVVVDATADERRLLAALREMALFCTADQAGPGLAFRLRSAIWPGPVVLLFDPQDEGVGPLLLHLLDHALAGGRIVIVAAAEADLLPVLFAGASAYDGAVGHAGSIATKEPDDAA